MRAIPFAALALLAGSNFCHATLGSAPSYRPAAEGTSPATSLPSVRQLSASNYSTIETMLPSGTRVREYVSTGGKVFAVAWDGPVPPNLRELLGQSFGVLVSESEKYPAAGHSQTVIRRPDVVIVSGGTMGAFTGRAWLPDQLPQGFASSDIR